MSAFRIGQRINGDELARSEKPVPAKSDPARRRWCAVEIKRGSEDGAEKEIAALDYVTYVPRFKTERWDRKIKSRKAIVQRPLFAGYLFARLDPAVDPWRELERIADVRGLVRACEQPIVVPDAVIAGLQEREPYNFGQPCRNLDANLKAFAVGDDVRLVDGNLVGFFGKVACIDERGRLTVLLDLFRRLTPVTLTIDQVERA